MHPIARFILLYVIAYLGVVGDLFLRLLLHGKSGLFTLYSEQLYSGISVPGLALVSAMLSMLLPPACFGHDPKALKEGEHPEATIFFVTSFVILPLLIVFMPSDTWFANHVLISREQAVEFFAVVGVLHGIINARHVHLLKRAHIES